VAAWRRLLRRAKAHLASPREPASFPLLVLRRSSSTDGAVDVSSRGTNRGIAVTGALFAAPWPGGGGGETPRPPPPPPEPPERRRHIPSTRRRERCPP
jgi:hypothetical protein